MVRGFTWFRCEKCGHTFMGLDMEWGATVCTAPLSCPKCGGTAYAEGLSGKLKRWFSKKG